MAKPQGPDASGSELFDDQNLDELAAAVAEAEPLEDGIDPNHPVLTVAEQRKALAQARDAIEVERKAHAIADFKRKQEVRLRGREGFVTGDPLKDELVDFAPSLPEFAQVLTVNGVEYHNGHVYRVPRHAFDSLREQEARLWRHQDDLDGKSAKRRAAETRRETRSLSGAGL